ncbi:MAG: aspartate kinase [Bacteroidales bacterium]|nr:aspartate kinase [Bacteroidales bacterium]MCF8456264.1 aspartate kinase [Bacteroidales bacterium]
MVTIPQAIDKILKQRPMLLEGLAQEIINLSSLARKIQPEVEEILHKQIKTGAVVMALKRFNPQPKIALTRRIASMVKNIGDITVRSNLASYTFLNSTAITEAQARLIRQIMTNNSIFYTISQGVFETTLIISTSFAPQVEEIFKKETIISHAHDLSSITLRLPPENKKVPGLYHYIFSRITWEGINVYEVISTTHEFSIIVNNTDVEEAFSVLKNLKN